MLEAGHPSPLNPRGFLGRRPFSAANKALADAGLHADRLEPFGARLSGAHHDAPDKVPIVLVRS